MSSWIVSEKTANIVVYAIKTLGQRHMFEKLRINRNRKGWEQRLLDRLMRINCRAWDENYPSEEKTECVKYQYDEIDHSISDTQLFKSIGCFTYQCDGLTNKPALLKYVEWLENDIAGSIVRGTKEYFDAVWDNWPEKTGVKV